jgi:hypothetical protein
MALKKFWQAFGAAKRVSNNELSTSRKRREQTEPISGEQTAPIPRESTASIPGKRAKPSLSEQLQAFLSSEYEFRYNLLTEETELRPATGNDERVFRPIDKRELNTLCLEAQARGIACWDRDVSRYIYSTRIAPYHPFHLYMEELPAWDGTDRLTELAHRVSEAPQWIAAFHRWMLGVAAQWMGVTDIHANSVAPILVSGEQGHQKSTFCRLLVPHALSRYYMDNLKLTTEGQVERMMAEMGLINLDEFDKYPEGKMPMLKNLMQMATLHIRKAYQSNFRDLPRIASFIGTSNKFDLLTDPTGSRRFICVEVTHTIDCSGICHKQIFAQLKAELEGGARSWFDKDEERTLQRHNAQFYRALPAEELFHSCFRAAEPGEECLELTATAIYQELQQHNAAALRGYNPARFGVVLTRAGVVRIHTRLGNIYQVVRR